MKEKKIDVFARGMFAGAIIISSFLLLVTLTGAISQLFIVEEPIGNALISSTIFAMLVAFIYRSDILTRAIIKMYKGEPL